MVKNKIRQLNLIPTPDYTAHDSARRNVIRYVDTVEGTVWVVAELVGKKRRRKAPFHGLRQEGIDINPKIYWSNTFCTVFMIHWKAGSLNVYSVYVKNVTANIVISPKLQVLALVGDGRFIDVKAMDWRS